MSAKILLVEDEDNVRKPLAQTLRDQGYEVDEASDGEEGLALLRAAAGGYALVICDVAMPLLDGHEMLRQGAGDLGKAGVLMLSAFDAAPPVEIGTRPSRVLAKPVGAGQVADEVRSLLAA